MKNKTDICDVCGHYWTPSIYEPDTCIICGSGSCIKLNSELDYRKSKRVNADEKVREFKERMVQNTVQ